MKGMVCMANTKKTNSNSIKSTKSKNTNLNVSKVELKEVEGAKHIFSQKNILIIVCIVLALILVIFYGYRVNKLKETDTLSKSYLLDSGTVSLEIKNLDEVNQILAESPAEYFVLISYTGNKDTYKLENGLKRILDKYKLNDSFYYLNVKSIMDEDNYLNRLNNAFNTDKIKKVPTILYYRNGKIVDVVTRNDNNIINAGDFQKLLDIYGYEGQ